MPVTEIYSKRQRRLRGEVPDVFQYDVIPEPFRIQVIHILEDAFGENVSGHDLAKKSYRTVHSLLCREYGVFELATENLFNMKTDKTDLISFFQKCLDTESVLDVIEVSFSEIEKKITSINPYRHNKITSAQAVEELNYRFLEHGIGYQYESGKIIRFDSRYIHEEVVKPVLLVLSDPKYKGANDEYLTAHEHYRQGRYEECLVYCLRSFESVMKVICEKHNWEYAKDKDTAKDLLDICFKNGLVPEYLSGQFSSIRSSLENGISPVRSKEAAHGQGIDIKEVPPYIASYLLHLTATSILFLADAEVNLTNRSRKK